MDTRAGHMLQGRARTSSSRVDAERAFFRRPFRPRTANTYGLGDNIIETA